MVYEGKPSTGCHACRKRKIKCDEKVPGCTQCARAKRPCPGYRRHIDIMFRDESANVAQKFTPFEAIQSREGTCPFQGYLDDGFSSASKFDNDMFTNSSFALIPTPIQALTAPLEDCAAPYFFTHWTQQATADSSDGHLNWLPDMYAKDEPQSPLTIALNAVGMAGLSNLFGSKELTAKARKNYGLALSATNKALRDPNEAIKDRTLVTILLLGYYETVTCENRKNLEAWSAHVNGATALLELRGLDQFHGEVGHSIFMHFLLQIVLNAFQTGIPVPHVVLTWLHNAPGLEDFVQLIECCVQFAELHSSVGAGKLINPEIIAMSALRIDLGLETWSQNLHSICHYRTMEHPRPCEDYWKQRFHVYNTPVLVYIWNCYRALRLVINEVILENLAICSGDPDDADNTEQSFTASFIDTHRRRSRSVITQMATEICYAIPTSLGTLPPPYDTIGRTMPMVISALSVLWPIYCAVGGEIRDEEMRKWSIRRLESVAATLGIKQAGILAWGLKNADLPPWRHIKVGV